MKKILLLLAVFLLAFFLRAAFLRIWYGTGQGGRLSGDAHGYLTLAENINEGKGFQLEGAPTARRPPIYPLLIAFLLKYSPFPQGVQLLQVLIGAMSCVVLFGLGKEMFGEGTGGWAAGIMAVDYLSIRQTVSVMPETLFVFFLLVSFYCLWRAWGEGKTGWVMAGGLAAGLSLLTKDVLIFFYPAMALWFLFWKQPWKIRLVRAGAFFFSLLLVIVPWIVRNNRYYHYPVLITAGSGYTLYLANNPSVRVGKTGGDWELGIDTDLPRTVPLPDLGGKMTEWEWEERYFRNQALDFIKNEPVQFIKLMGKKIVNMWRPFQTDSPLAAQWASAAAYLPVLFLGLGGMAASLKRWREFFPVFLLCVYLFLLHAVLIGHIRYRYPLMPFFMIFAAFAMFELRKKSPSLKS